MDIERIPRRHFLRRGSESRTGMSRNFVPDNWKICSGVWDLIEPLLLTLHVLIKRRTFQFVSGIMNDPCGDSSIPHNITQKCSHKERKNRNETRQNFQLMTEPETHFYPSHITKHTKGNKASGIGVLSCRRTFTVPNPVKYSSLRLRGGRHYSVVKCLGLLCLLMTCHASKRARTPEGRQTDEFAPSRFASLFPNAGPNAGLYPSLVNLAAQADISANATCGENGPEDFCKLVEHVHRISRRRRRRRRSQCDTCSSTSSNPGQRHDIAFAIDEKGSWWQSPSINNGYEYHWVTITLDLKQVFQVAYFILKAANSPRPGNWILEKSVDGVSWEPWQYFAVSDHECRRLYPARVARMGSPRLLYDNEVVCTSYFSQLLPLQNGEIHISLVNGRPSAENPSDELIDFTSTRFVRLRFQKIRTLLADLMTIAKRTADQVDPSVTRRYFYSIKDISIGGMCICYGHAHDCPENPFDGKFICKCEHNTMGDNCEQCLPMFNQHKWSPGKAGFECEKCNCHGHATSCYYDENVEKRKESLNVYGVRNGGGVCIECQDFTEGVNCESCVDGFFRPINVLPSDTNPCQPCDCDIHGTRTSINETRICRKSVDDSGRLRGIMPGDCYCKEGYTGPKCNLCDFGYHNFPNCEPCPCNVAGSSNSDPCVGDCVCKDNVAGEHCERCKVGYFNMKRYNDAGCDKCYCSGIAAACDSAALYREALRSLRGWVVADRAGSHEVLPTYDENRNEAHVAHEETSNAVCSGLYYWMAPNEFLGNKLSSYGGELRYTIYYELPMSSQQTLTFRDVDVVLEGAGISLELSLQKDVRPYVSTPFVAHFKKDAGWLEANTQLPATKQQILQALSNVRRLLIRASHNRSGKSVFLIRDLSMDIATPDGNGEPVSSVEKCYCPPGYAGLSCEDCSPGYHRNGRSCVPCKCNGHSDTCSLFTGVCERCQHGTTGMHCEICLPGYYGDATKGKCKKCACPLEEESNNFSPTCQFDELDNTMICLNCPTGYAGHQCERCAPGYFGNPTILGEQCKPCECNGNSFTCDKVTGICTDCQRNTAGPNCERCATGFYGDAILRKDCVSCGCDPVGSYSNRCNPATGQCSCRPGVFGRQCNSCSGDEYLDRTSRSCVSCMCNEGGSDGTACGPAGQCRCKNGVTGRMCDRCDSGYYGLDQSGCKKCRCPTTNNHCDPVTGACVCPPRTTGYKCSQCAIDAYGWSPDTGCQPCACHNAGSRKTQCDVLTGQCNCNDEYTGRQCNECRESYYDFPNCLPCACHVAGTEKSSCDKEVEECTCSNAGQCECKENVVGVKCNRCLEGTFSLQPDNPKGCTECFCFGVTNQCKQAEYHWGSPISLSARSSKIAVANQINTRSTTEGVLVSENSDMVSMDPRIVRRSLRYEPYYWRLPPQFNGDKLTSYGGKLQFTIYFAAAIDVSPHVSAPTVVIRGRRNGTTIAYQLNAPHNRQDNSYTLFMRESGWSYLDTNHPVTRGDFTFVLHDIEYFLIKASHGNLMDQSRLSDVFLDVAEEGSGGGRGDSTAGGDAALGVEICFCPPGYKGLSCQECDIGYTRIRSGKYLGECRPCACNGKSDSCDVSTGVCLACRDNFEGDRCDRCKVGFYPTPGPNGLICRKCSCPLSVPENNFSPTCRPTSRGNHVCDQCPRGYQGPHCERCALGYYGDPTKPGGFCKKCGCNPAGSVNSICDQVTGQCICVEGITGKVCDQCRPHYAITENGCISCDDDCSGKLLREIEALTRTTKAVGLENMFPPPWGRLVHLENQTREIEMFMDTALTDMMDSLMLVHEVSPPVNEMIMTIEVIVEKSNMLYLTYDDIVYRTNRTSEKFVRKLKYFENLVKESQNLANKMRRLLELQEKAIDIDESEIVSRIADLIAELRSRNMSKYQDFSDDELRLANELLSQVRDDVTTPARRFVNRLKRNRQKIDDATEEITSKLDELYKKLLESQKKAKDVKKLNKQNQIMTRQLQADVGTLQNQITMVLSATRSLRILVNETEYKMEETHTYMEQLKAQRESLKNLLMELKLESDKIATAPPKLERLGALVTLAKQHTMHLMEKATYFQQTHKNVSEFSLKQTSAATRFSKIADNIADANITARKALQIAVNTMTMDNGDVIKGTDSTLTKTVQLLNEITKMEENLHDTEEKLQNMKVQMNAFNTSDRDLSRRLRKIKKGYNNLNLDPPTGIERTNVISRDANDITGGVMNRTSKLRDDVNYLQNALAIANKYSEITTEIRDNMKEIPSLVTQAREASTEGRAKGFRLKRKNTEVQEKIDELRRQIRESRMKAAAIRGASVKSEGECKMRYLPTVTPGRFTDIQLTLMVESPDNTLFYLGRDEGDYILITTANGKVQVSWDLGSGEGEFISPVSIVKDPGIKEDWYQIDLKRQDQLMKLTVYRRSNKSGTTMTISQSSPGDSAILDVDERDYLFIGGVDENVKLPKEVSSRTFTGCMGEAHLQGKVVGLWNFVEVSDPSHCDGCSAVPEEFQPVVSYGYNGNSYSLIQYYGDRHQETRVTILDVEFRTLTSSGLLLYMGSSLTKDFMLIEFVDGHLVARVDIGSGVQIIQSKRRYNIGKWCSVHLRRLDALVRLTAQHPDGREMAEVEIQNSDGHFNVSIDDLICVGSCPTDHVLNSTLPKNGFIGCLKNFKIFNNVQPLTGTSHVLRFSEVEQTCPKEISRDIGIDDRGFVELPGHALPVSGSVSITFNSREPDALLLLATDGLATRRKRRKRQSDKNFYSLSLSGGHIEARLRATSGSPLILTSSLGRYSDGDEHTALLKREGDRIHLIVDDDIEGLVSGRLPRGGRQELPTSRVFVGGLPDSLRLKDMPGSGSSINGCIRELVMDGLIDFENATKVENSYIGSCAYTQTFPVPRTTIATTTTSTTPSITARRSGPVIRSTTPVVTPSAIIPITTTWTTTRSTTTTTEAEIVDTRGCVAQGELPALRGSTVHFGRSSRSRLEFAFDDDISTKFRVQIEFRTVASHGLLLYAASEEYDDFFSLQLKNGMPIFLFDSGKGPGRAVGNFTVNDGRWHSIRMSRSKRKGYLKVDSMRYEMAKSPKGANRMDITKVLYVGGVKPSLDVERLSGVWQSLDSCVRSVSMNKVKFDLENPDAEHETDSCYANIEEGAYFDGQGHAVYDDRYRVGPEMTIELEFRTWARDGVLVSVSDSRRGDGLALEIVNGSIIFCVNNGAGDIVAKFTPKMEFPRIELCDGMWHRVKATKIKYLLTLTVDGQFHTNPETSMVDSNSADTEHPLYIGGYPDYASPQRQLTTNKHFRGCIRRMKLKGQMVDFSQVYDYTNIYPNSCPRSNVS